MPPKKEPKNISLSEEFKIYSAIKKKSNPPIYRNLLIDFAIFDGIVARSSPSEIREQTLNDITAQQRNRNPEEAAEVVQKNMAIFDNAQEHLIIYELIEKHQQEGAQDPEQITDEIVKALLKNENEHEKQRLLLKIKDVFYKFANDFYSSETNARTIVDMIDEGKKLGQPTEEINLQIATELCGRAVIPEDIKQKVINETIKLFSDGPSPFYGNFFMPNREKSSAAFLSSSSESNSDSETQSDPDSPSI